MLFSTNKKNNMANTVCDVVPERDCTGCSACMNVCPLAAITMTGNVVGHILPSIDSSKCIECGMCTKVCPANKTEGLLNSAKKAYASWAKDDNEHRSSSSGGLASVLSNYVVEKGGIVYGCASLKGCVIQHIRIDRKSDVSLLKGSKYVQSEIGFSYKNIKKDLTEGKKVLFIGMPCQVAGLRSYLNKDYDRLITIDLVCHGVSSQKLLLDHVRSLGINPEDVERVGFRENASYIFSLKDTSDKILYRKDDLHDMFYSGYNDNLFLRESCVACKYAKSFRTGDITLGDFHGIGKHAYFNEITNGAVSLVLVNTEKGEILLRAVERDVELRERLLEEAMQSNPNFSKPSKRKSDYNKFVNLYPKIGYKKATVRCMRLRFIKNYILTIRYKINKYF